MVTLEQKLDLFRRFPLGTTFGIAKELLTRTDLTQTERVALSWFVQKKDDSKLRALRK